jgi:GTP cyclohydrolase I
VPASLVANILGLPLLDRPMPHGLVVDDIIDSGATRRRFTSQGFDFDALYITRREGAELVGPTVIDEDTWLVFPWETVDEQAGPADAVVRLLEFLGEDPTRPGLVDTPRRVLDSLAEMTDGYQADPAEHLGVVFPDRCDEMVVVTGIDFTSLCEHHLLTFSGRATVAYIPDGQVVGLSKLARVVDVFAHRLQVQERLTEQIAEAIETHLSPAGVGVVIEATHSCMVCRGVRKPGATMVTSALRGALKDKPAARAEFLTLARR